MAIVIAQRQRIEERAKNDPAQDALHDGDENIGEDAIETVPSADPASEVARNKPVNTDYSAFFFSPSPKVCNPSFGRAAGGYIIKKIILPFSATQ